MDNFILSPKNQYSDMLAQSLEQSFKMNSIVSDDVNNLYKYLDQQDKGIVFMFIDDILNIVGQVCDRILDSKSYIQIVWISKSQQNVIEAFMVGADYYMLFPIDDGELKNALNDLALKNYKFERHTGNKE